MILEEFFLYHKFYLSGCYTEESLKMNEQPVQFLFQ